MINRKKQTEPYLSTYLHSKGRKLGLPIAGNFELTARCNFNCPMCYVHMNENQIRELSNLSFVENHENIVFIGNPGVGKTHLAVALGIEAAKHRNSVYFITCHNLMLKLNKAQKENRLDKQLQHLAQYKVLIIDEIGYLPVDHQGSNLFFQLIAKRYMNKSTIVTTNMPFSRWGEVFSDNTLASAVLDRLLHYSHIIRITGNSYRIGCVQLYDWIIKKYAIIILAKL